MSPSRLFLLCVLILPAAAVAHADDAHDLLKRVRTTIAGRLPLFEESTLQVRFKNTTTTLAIKCCRCVKRGAVTEIWQTQAWNILQDNVPAFFVPQPDALLDPLDPVSETAAGAAGARKSEGALRSLGKEQIDGVGYDVVEITQTSEQLGQMMSFQGPLTVKSIVRKLYIGQDGLVHRISGDVSWTEDHNAPAGERPPVQSAQFVLNVTAYRKAVTFAPRPESQPPTQTVVLKQPGGPWQFTFALSQDGRLMALGSRGSDIHPGDIHLLDIGTSQEKRVLSGHPAQVTALAFSPDGKRLASADSLVMAGWNLETGQLLYTVRDQPNITALTFSPNGKFVLSTGNDGQAQLRDATTGRKLRTIVTSFPDHYLFSPDGAYLATRSGYDVLLWNTKTWQPIEVEGRSVPTGGHVAFSPDSTRLALGGHFGSLFVWDTRSGRKLQELKGAPGSISAVWFSPDGRTVTALDTDQRGDAADNSTGLTTWDTMSWQEISSLNLNGGKGVEMGVGMSPGNTFVFPDRLGQLDVWQATLKFWTFPILPAGR